MSEIVRQSRDISWKQQGTAVTKTRRTPSLRAVVSVRDWRALRSLVGYLAQPFLQQRVNWFWRSFCSTST